MGIYKLHICISTIANMKYAQVHVYIYILYIYIYTYVYIYIYIYDVYNV